MEINHATDMGMVHPEIVDMMKMTQLKVKNKKKF